MLTMDQALAQGRLGPQPVSAETRASLGDIVVVPHLEYFIWWRAPGIVDNPFHGHHGCLSAEELVTVLGGVDAL